MDNIANNDIVFGDHDYVDHEAQERADKAKRRQAAAEMAMEQEVADAIKDYVRA